MIRALCLLVFTALTVGAQAPATAANDTLPAETVAQNREVASTLDTGAAAVDSSRETAGNSGDSTLADAEVDDATKEMRALVLDSLFVEGLYNPEQAPMVRRQTGLKKGQVVNSQVIQSTIKKLYSLGLFKSADFFVKGETDSSVSLVLKVQEYPLLESIEYSGMKKLKKEDVEEVMTLKKGQALSDAAIFTNIRAMKKKYAEKGYVLAEISSELIPTKVPGNVIAKFKVKEGSKVQVKQIVFKGVNEMKEKRIKRKFRTKERKALWGGDFDQELYRAHLDSLIMFYNDEGYLEAEVVKDSMWYDASKKDITIEITLHEGRKYYAGDFFYTGNRVLESSELSAQTGLRKGKPFSKAKFDVTRESVANRYREEGYLWVQIADRRSYRGDTIDVTFDIVEGRPAIVRKIDIVGNEKTAEKVVRREIRLMPGQKYKQSMMMRSVRDIMQLNYFGNVNPDLRPNDDGTVDFVFQITEKDNIGQLSLGAAYSQVDGAMGTFSVSIPNFRGVGEQLDLSVEYGKYRQNFSVGFMEPWAFDTPTRLSGSIFYRNSIYNLSSSGLTNSRDEEVTSYGFALGAGRKLKWPDDYFYLKGNYQLSREMETGLNQGELRYADADSNYMVRREGILSKLSFDLIRDDTDIPTFPTSGSVLSLSPEIVGLGGDFQYLKGTLGVKNYFPLFWKFVLGSEAKFGLIHNLGNWPLSISKYDLFKGGGVYGSDVVNRGYPEYSFGGYNDFASKDGLAMFSLNTEMRFPILDQQLYFGVFADMGNTWSSFSEVDFRDLNKSVGFGLRLMIPMLGLMGFDFGWGLDDLKRDGHFSNKSEPNLHFNFIMNRGF